MCAIAIVDSTELTNLRNAYDADASEIARLTAAVAAGTNAASGTARPAEAAVDGSQSRQRQRTELLPLLRTVGQATTLQHSPPKITAIYYDGVKASFVVTLNNQAALAKFEVALRDARLNVTDESVTQRPSGIEAKLTIIHDVSPLRTRLSARRWMVVIASGVISCLILLYVLWWKPLQGELARLRIDAPKQHQQLEQLIAKKTIAQSAPETSAPAVTNVGLIDYIGHTSGSYNLRDHIKDFRLERPDAVKFTVEDASLSVLLGWLSSMQHDRHMKLESASITSRPASNTVNAVLALTDPRN
jgi:type II secretory pathway component PulM